MRLSCVVVVPAYNEEGNIARVVADWTAELKAVLGDACRILVIDDGSHDATGEILDRITQENDKVIVCHQGNQGHGGAVMNGYRQATSMETDYVFQTDSDDQFDAADFSVLWGRRKESHFILGFRKVRNDPIHRIVLSKIAAALIYMLFAVRLKDSNVPYRLMERNFLLQCLPVVPAGAFAPNICLAIIAAYRKQPLLHIPVRHRKRVTGQSLVSKALLKGCVRSFFDLFRLRIGICHEIPE